MSRLGSIGHKLYSGEISFDFVGRWRWWFGFSIVAILVAVIGLLANGLNLSIDFRGGVDFQVPVAQSSRHVETVRNAVTGTGIDAAADPVVTSLGDKTVQVETRALDPNHVATVRKAIAKSVGQTETNVTYTSIGPSWGSQITTKAARSLVVFIILVMAVIWAYFREWRMSVAAIIALFHDLIVTVGVYALVGFDVTPGTVIGVLTILGYSLYDTVVVFDKVRENTRGVAAGSLRTYSMAANDAVNQTLVRSINTSVTALLPVAGILFVGAGLLGAGTLKDLALALFIGIAAGTYSSIFVATPALCLLKEREPAMRALAKRVVARQAGLSARAAKLAAEPVPVVGGAPVAAAEPTGSASPTGPARPAGVADRPGPATNGAAHRATPPGRAGSAGLPAGQPGAGGRRQPQRRARSNRRRSSGR